MYSNRFHFHMGNLTRNGCNKSSYISGLTLNYHGQKFDIRSADKKGEVVYSEVIIPDGYDERLKDRNFLWGLVEDAEKRDDAKRAKDGDMALPNELSLDTCKKIVGEYVNTNFTKKGYIVDLAIHWEINNHHAQFLSPTRPIDKDGNIAKFKSRKVWSVQYEYEKDENGKEIKDDNHRIQQVHPITKEPLWNITYDENGNRIKEPEYRVPQKDPSDPKSYLWQDLKVPILDRNGNFILNKYGKPQYKKVPELDENGKPQKDKNGNVIYKKVPEFRIPLIDKKTGKQKVDDRNRKQWKSYKEEFNELNDKSFLINLRKSWANICNKYIINENDKITEKSYKTRIEEGELPMGYLPKKYVSRKVYEDEKRGNYSDIDSQENIERKEHNKEVDECYKKIEEILADEIAGCNDNEKNKIIKWYFEDLEEEEKERELDIDVSDIKNSLINNKEKYANQIRQKLQSNYLSYNEKVDFERQLDEILKDTTKSNDTIIEYLIKLLSAIIEVIYRNIRENEKNNRR